MVRYDRRKGAPQEETFSREPLTRLDLPVWREIPVMLAVKLYGAGRLSSERASKLAGISHVEFFFSLGFYKVFPLQFELNELEQLKKQKDEQAAKMKNGEKSSPNMQDMQPVQRKQSETSRQDEKPANEVKEPIQEIKEEPPGPVHSRARAEEAEQE